MVDYITDGLEKIAYTDCMNFIVERMIAENYDVDWMKITQKDRQITFNNNRNKYKRTRLVDSGKVETLYDIAGQPAGQKPVMIEEKYYIEPSDVEVKQEKKAMDQASYSVLCN